MGDWQQVSLGEICSIEIGGTPSRSESRYWWKSEDDGARLPWVSISDMKEKVITDTKESITEIGALQSNCKHVPKGTLLMSFKLTIGRLAFAGRDLYTNEAISAIKPLKDICPEFLYYGLQHWNLTGDSDQAVKGVTLNKQKLQEIPCQLPPLPEQKKIAEILSGIDKEIFIHIHKLEGLSTLLRNLLGEHFQERCRSGNLCLKDVICAPIQYGANASAVKLRTGQPRYIRITDIKDDGTLNESNAVGIDLAFGDYQGYLLRQGDLLLARTGNTVGKSYLHSNGGEEMVFAGYLLRVALDENAYRPEYLFLFTKCDIYNSWISEASRTGAQPNINAKEYGAMIIPDTSLEDQEAFTKKALSLNQAMRQLEKKVKKLQFLRQALSADLLSGRKRVTL